MNTEIDGKWLREIGFTYHALGKYFYLTTYCDILLIHELACGDWVLSAVNAMADPDEYDDLSAVLSSPATRQDVMTIVEMCNRE